MAYSPRIRVASDYLSAVGRATYNFAYLEWVIIWTGQELAPGFISKAQKLTAGQISERFATIVSALDEQHPARVALLEVAASFKDLVIIRNQLMHAKPYTADRGEQRLLYNGKSGRKDWPADAILETAAAFEALAIKGNNIFHRVLRSAKPGR